MLIAPTSASPAAGSIGRSVVGWSLVVTRPSLRGRTFVRRAHRRSPGRMAAMARRILRTLAGVIAAGAIACSSVVGTPVLAADPEATVPLVDSGPPVVVPASVATSAIVPGSVDRSSLFLDATYDAYLKISWGPRTIYVDSTATIRNTSGGPIDRVELNTIATRLGAIRLTPVTVDGATVAATISDQTHRRAARRRPAGRRRRPPSGSATARPCGAACRARTGCSPGPTRSSTSTAGCRG